MAETILYTPSDSDLRAQKLEKELQQVKRKLIAVQSELKWMKDDLKIKEDEHSKKHNNNLQMLKKFLEEKYRLHHKSDKSCKQSEREIKAIKTYG